MKRIRILTISNSGDVIGGGEISFCQLVQGLDRERFAVTVMCPSEGEVAEMVRGRGGGITAEGAEGGGGGRREEGVEFFGMPGLKGLGLLGLPARTWKLARLMRRGGYELVYANGSRCMAYAGLAARLAGCPVVWHVRITEGEALDRLLARLASRIVVNSQATARRFGFLNGGRPAVSVVHNGVDLSEFDPNLSGEAVRQELRICADAPLVVIVGRLDAWKGHRCFLEAAAEMARCDARVRFLVVGDGRERQDLEEQSRRLGLDGRVVFTGRRDDVPRILAASDVVVSASCAESFGRVLIEAMAMRKPVVAARAGGVPEIVLDGQTGLLVEPENSRQMAQALCRLLRDAGLSRRMGEAGRQRVEERFGAEKHAAEMGAILERVSGSFAQRRKDAKEEVAPGFGLRASGSGNPESDSGLATDNWQLTTEENPASDSGLTTDNWQLTTEENPESDSKLRTANCELRTPLCIGIDVREWEEGRITGIGRYLLNFLSYAAQRRPDCRFQLYGNQHSRLAELPANVRLQVIPERAIWWWDQVSLGRRLRRDRVQVFLSPYPKGPLAAPCPYVTTIHDLLFLRVADYTGDRRALYNRLFRMTARLYSRGAARVITDSLHSRQDIIELLGLPPEKIAVIPIGLQTHFQPVPDAAPVCRRYGIEGRFVLCVGNFKPHKNLGRLLEAFRKVCVGDSPLQLVLAGHDAEYRPGLLQRVRELGLEDAVIWAGLVDDADLPALYTAAELLVMPSLYEGFGLPALEAMACGTPVVASRTTSLPEVVGDAGLLVDPEDVPRMAQAIGRLLNDEELRRECRRKGLERARRFSLEATAGLLLELIEEIAKEAAGAEGAVS